MQCFPFKDGGTWRVRESRLLLLVRAVCEMGEMYGFQLYWYDTLFALRWQHVYAPLVRTRDFGRWAMQTNRTETFPFTDREDFYSAASEWVTTEESMRKGLSWSNRSSPLWTEDSYFDYSSATGFAVREESSTLYFTFATFITSLEQLEDGHPNTRLWKLYDHAQEALAAAETASGMTGGIQVGAKPRCTSSCRPHGFTWFPCSDFYDVGGHERLVIVTTS